MLSQFTPKMCAAVEKSKKITKTSYIKGSKSLKVINVDTPLKPVSSSCYNKPNVYV